MQARLFLVTMEGSDTELAAALTTVAGALLKTTAIAELPPVAPGPAQALPAPAPNGKPQLAVENPRSNGRLKWPIKKQPVAVAKDPNDSNGAAAEHEKNGTLTDAIRIALSTLGPSFPKSVTQDLLESGMAVDARSVSSIMSQRYRAGEFEKLSDGRYRIAP